VVFLLLTIGAVDLDRAFQPWGMGLLASSGVICLALAAYGLGVLAGELVRGIIFLITALCCLSLISRAPTHGR